MDDKDSDGSARKRRMDVSQLLAGLGDVRKKLQRQAEATKAPEAAEREQARVGIAELTAQFRAPEPTSQFNARKREEERLRKLQDLQKVEAARLRNEQQTAEWFDPRLESRSTSHKPRRAVFRAVADSHPFATPESLRVTPVDQGVKDPVVAREEPKTELFSSINWWDAQALGLTQASGLLSAETATLLTGLSDEALESELIAPLAAAARAAYETPSTPVVAEREVTMPVMLTAEERKKLRRRQRAERLQEDREAEALGLKEPAPARLRLSSLMRIMGSQTVQDPTAMERQVREQMEARLRAHEAANESRKLTPEQRREKKLRKLGVADEDKNFRGPVHVAVFLVRSLAERKNRAKLSNSAAEWRLTGAAIRQPGCNCVLVEGARKPLEKFKKLMLRRINWLERAALADAELTIGSTMRVEEGEEDESKGLAAPHISPEQMLEEEAADERAAATMDAFVESPVLLLWEGLALHRSFTSFSFRGPFSQDSDVRASLRPNHAEHLYQLAREPVSIPSVRILVHALYSDCLKPEADSTSPPRSPR